MNTDELEVSCPTPEEFDLLSREDQGRILKAANQEILLRKSQKLLFYVPTPKQKAFHTSKVSLRAVFGGNRSGKTTCGGVEFLFHATGIYPDWYPKDMRYTNAIKARIIARDFAKGVGEVIIPFLEEWLDSSLVKRKHRNSQGVPWKWELKNGSVFDILTHEQDVEQFEGWKGHFAWFDEPPPRDRYIATLRGLVDYMGRCWLTMTPLNQPWVYDELYTKNEPARIFTVTTDIRDNPYLTPEAVREFEKSLTEEEKEARLHGRFLHLTGLIYKEFNPDIHICEAPIVKPQWTRYMAIDPHERTPTAVLWLAVDPKGNHWIYDELWMQDMDIEQISHAIHAQEGELPARIRLIDPHNDKDYHITGISFNIRKELMKYNIYCERANSDPALGKARIKQALKPRYSSLFKTEIPQLRVSRDCTHTIYEFQHYIWDSYRRNADEFGKKDAVKKINDHFMDCLRYIYNFDPRYIPPDDEDASEIKYGGTYTKYPERASAPKGSYHALVEGAGEF
jgi:phage terminase large subunit-like protein